MALDVSLAERLAGGVWGHLVGDALGVPYEGWHPNRIGAVRFGVKGTHDQPPGTWSDDGGLMLALLDSLLKAGFNTTDQARRALAWLVGPDYKPGPVFSIGGTTEGALTRIADGVAAEAAGGADENNNGNGSLMRILPVALVGSGLEPATLVDWSFRSSAVTHRHPRSLVTCALYTLLAAELINGEPDRALALQRAMTKLDSLVPAGMAHELQLIRAHDIRSGDFYVVDTFWSAWDAFVKGHTYAEVVESAVAYGNDTDTTAAVAGGLAGAYWGASDIPTDWLRHMRGRTIVDEAVTLLCSARGVRPPDSMKLTS
jgi:ADP-ribosyl-[dinitrogen reductase] hydrolase